MAYLMMNTSFSKLWMQAVKIFTGWNKLYQRIFPQTHHFYSYFFCLINKLLFRFLLLSNHSSLCTFFFLAYRLQSSVGLRFLCFQRFFRSFFFPLQSFFHFLSFFRHEFIPDITHCIPSSHSILSYFFAGIYRSMISFTPAAADSSLQATLKTALTDPYNAESFLHSFHFPSF